MDAGYKDENEYIFVTARDDDVINVAGHRISTLSLEDAVLRHPDVADAAVFGVPESTKGEVPLCLYVTKDGVGKTSAKLSVELIKIIREVIGPIASFKLVAPVAALPRTRSGWSTNAGGRQAHYCNTYTNSISIHRQNHAKGNGWFRSQQASHSTGNGWRSIGLSRCATCLTRAWICHVSPRTASGHTQMIQYRLYHHQTLLFLNTFHSRHYSLFISYSSDCVWNLIVEQC